MDAVVYATPPTPGSAQPGNLYADLQSRSLWLGVDPTVDVAQAVLISDIVALQAQITSGDTSARAYTDTQITTRAPTVHNHTSSQITDFNAAVTSVASAIPALQWVRGMILIWSGLLTDVGIDNLSGWALCDGSNGTPDLRDRFIIGAGTNRLPGLKNPLATISTNEAGAHTPVVNAYALTIANMPAHAHTFADSGTATTGLMSANHNHVASSGQFVTWGGAGGSIGTTYSGGQPLQVSGASTSLASADHSHQVTISVSGTTNSQGNTAAHTHTAAAVASHHHDLTTGQIRDVTPFYALAFIMKL